MADDNGNGTDQSLGSVLMSISALLAGVVFLGLANGMFFTLLGIRMSIDGESNTMIGIVGSAYFAGMLAGTLWCGKVIRRVRHIRAFTVFAAGSSVAAILHPLIPEVWVWVALRAAMGFGMAGLFMVSESWLQFKATNRTRGRTFACYLLAHTAGVGLGPLLVTLVDPTGFELFALSSILFSIALLPVALTTTGNPELGSAGRFGVRELYAISPVAMVGSFAIGMSVSAFSTLGPAYAERIGLTAATIALFMTAPRLGAFVLQYPVGAYSDRFDRRKVMVAMSLGAALVCLAFVAYGATGAVVALALSCLYGAFSQPVYSLVVAHANDHVKPEQFVATSAGLLFAQGIGASIGPLIASLAMDWMGSGGLFVYSAVILAGFASFILYRQRRRAAPGERRGFVVVPRSAPTATLLDPRAPWERVHDPERLKVERALDEARQR